jgi:aspartate carbamoyltransferase catalytic subunit
MLRLGGKSISSADPATSSAAKGESLADTVRVASNYADVLVIRHPRDGAVKLAATYANVPVINGGDGAHEHPTQTLCDLFTLLQEGKKLQHLNVAISGDLKGSRTIHSFVYALARFGANILMMPAKGMELPGHVDWRLRNELNCFSVPRARYEKDNSSVDALYMTADKPHQLSLIADANLKVRKNIDAMYVTRFQKERWTDKAENYPTVDQRFLKDKRYSKTSVLHPLPRVGELDIALDSDRRAAYFRQAAFGVPIRMALIAAILGFRGGDALKRYPGGFRPAEHPIYDQPNAVGIECDNKNCIVHDPQEGRYTRNRFYLIGEHRLRCFYCETDIAEFVVANKAHQALRKRNRNTAPRSGP